MNHTTQVTLLERLREGDGAMAWDEFFGRYWHLVFQTARHRGCQDHTAEEIVQEVMLTVFQQRDVFQYDPSKGRFRDWLRKVVRNAVAQHRRAPAQRVRARGGEREGPVLETIEDDGLDQWWDARFERSLLTALLDVVRREVAPETYQAFELITLEDLSGAEVASITGLTRNAVYLARKRILKRLQQLGATYRDEGQLADNVREALRSYPEAGLERSLTNRVAHTMRGR
jgi:RNA polymerase sigma-70 factor (ECF subfamily)